MPATIFSGNDVKALKSNLNLNDAVKYLTGTDDPTGVAKDAPASSLYHKTDTGEVFRKLDNGSSTNWEIIGAGGGGINYIDLQGSHDAESGTDGWATYQDAASVDPVDGSGGAPTVTLTSQSTNVLRGTKSFRLAKDAANRQGEGVSFDYIIDEADKGKTLKVSFDYAERTGNYVTGDVRVWLYDVTAASLIEPTVKELNASSGRYQATFDNSNSLSYRLIIHIAGTNALALNFDFDNVSVGPQELISGTPSSDWISAGAMTIEAVTVNPTKGTVAKDELLYRRDGDSWEIIYQYNQTAAGAAGTGAYNFKLPAFLAADTNKITLSATSGDIQPVIGAASASRDGSLVDGNLVLIDGTTVQLVASDHNTAPTTISDSFGNLAGTNVKYSFHGKYPGAGLSSNVTMSNGSTFKMSAILANGTRVTSTPTKLGEYRTRYRAAATSAVLTDVAPTAAPSADDGMLIYGNVGWSSAGTAGQISVWEVFIGKNKHYRTEWYKNAGKSGVLFTPDLNTLSSTVERGAVISYDPSNGVVSIDAAVIELTTNTTRSLALQDLPAVDAPSGYFDLIVSENALAVGLEKPRSEIILTGGNGHGSTNTRIRRFTNILKNVGPAISVTQSAANGDSFTINEDGLYVAYYSDGNTAAGSFFGFSKNSAQLTTSVLSITSADLIVLTGANNDIMVASAHFTAQKGDIIRPHTDAAPNRTTDQQVRISIMKVSD